MTRYPFIKLDFNARAANEMLSRSRAFLQLIRRRRSVRDYTDRTIPREVIEHVLKTQNRWAEVLAHFNKGYCISHGIIKCSRSHNISCLLYTSDAADE